MHTLRSCSSSDAASAARPLRVGDALLHPQPEQLNEAERRQLASLALLRLAAIEDGLLSADDPPPSDGVISEAAADAIDRWLEQAIPVPDPDEAACRRFFAAHPARYAQGERVQARHILFAVTPGVDVQALRQRAEQVLVAVRAAPETFAEVARTTSNCPSGEQGGELGWLRAEDCAPEFARELFGQDEAQAHIGVLPRLVHSRFGLHVVEVQAREAGVQPTFEQVQQAVAQSLRQQAFATALKQACAVLAARHEVVGADLDAATSPLLQ
ncbi:peptidylprolyl isomerase [Aquabacterium sp.]|uniref:peptidylprolyl isomerase n=1 Tax=Aquabacterium sp. TaxID=1872578 RepID=UPI001DEAD629|nr:peptidylprolyl isomerase [Aquabacterium sp.]MBT9608610.1 peptidyl-prolyl cis-trans isomerase [Aquabacterium sp.]